MGIQKTVDLLQPIVSPPACCDSGHNGTEEHRQQQEKQLEVTWDTGSELVEKQHSHSQTSQRTNNQKQDILSFKISNHKSNSVL